MPDDDAPPETPEEAPEDPDEEPPAESDEEEDDCPPLQLIKNMEPEIPGHLELIESARLLLEEAHAQLQQAERDLAKALASSGKLGQDLRGCLSKRHPAAVTACLLAYGGSSAYSIIDAISRKNDAKGKIAARQDILDNYVADYEALLERIADLKAKREACLSRKSSPPTA